MTTGVQPISTATTAGRIGRVRWVICGLLFFATTINYLDRQVLSILKPLLEKELGWTEADYGWIAFSFTLGYGLAMPLAGRMIDRLGTRFGYALAVAVWSLAAMSHAFARTVFQFIAARLVLSVSEAGNFPAAVRTVADWFPLRERSLATGIFNSGSNVGLVLAAGAPFVASRFGWQATFILTGAVGALFLIPWLWWYRSPAEHGSLSRTELAYIRSGTTTASSEKIPYARLVSSRAAWGFMAGKFLTDPVWWFFLFWIPSFLNRTYQLDVASLGPPLLVIYLAADIGSIGGGWLFKGFSALGWTPNAARKAAMLSCAAAALPVIGILFVETLWPAVALIGLAAAAHQGWSANLFTLVSDTFPAPAVGSVVGLGGLAGAIGGMLISPAVGYWLDFSGGSYRPIFVIASVAYLAALCLIHLLLPRIGPPQAGAAS